MFPLTVLAKTIVSFPVLADVLAQNPGIDFQTMAKGLAVVSLGMIGAVLAGAGLFKEQAEQYKKQIFNVILGLALVSLSAFLVSFF